MWRKWTVKFTSDFESSQNYTRLCPESAGQSNQLSHCAEQSSEQPAIKFYWQFFGLLATRELARRLAARNKDLLATERA